MNTYPHPIIAREGWPFLAITLAASLYAQASWGLLLALPMWLLLLFVFQFFRDPPRSVAGVDHHAVVAPADGRIVAVQEVNDPYLQRKAIKVSVFMNVFNVHSNRSPVDGAVVAKWYNPGTFINAALDKASAENERCALHIRTADNQDVTAVQIAGLVARRILNYVEPGTPLLRGQRYGFIRFGSRVDVYLPLDARIKVVIGEKVSASTTLLAELA